MKAITNLAVPKTLKDVQSLLGLTQVAREYLPSLATIIAPIQMLAKKGVDIVAAWGEDKDIAFNNLKHILTTAPVLLIPDVTKRFRIHVDCCKVGRGCGLFYCRRMSRDYGCL